MDFVEAVYRLSQKFPREELHGLTNQLRRAAVSVPSNIAEGQGRGIGNEFSHHLRISNGARQEAETQIPIGIRLGYITDSDAVGALGLGDECGRLLKGVHRSITGN
jgi:four helix bundle protein